MSIPESKSNVKQARQQLKKTKRAQKCDLFFVIMRLHDRTFRTWKKTYGDFSASRTYETRLEASIAIDALPTDREHHIFQVKVTVDDISVKRVRHVSDDMMRHEIKYAIASREFHESEPQI
jgi:hypothetical protein